MDSVRITADGVVGLFNRLGLQQADLIIAPDMQGFTSTSFGSSAEIIKLGYEGAKEKEVLLRGLSLSEAEWRDLELADEPGYTTHLITRHALRFIEQNRAASEGKDTSFAKLLGLGYPGGRVLDDLARLVPAQWQLHKAIDAATLAAVHDELYRRTLHGGWPDAVLTPAVHVRAAASDVLRPSVCLTVNVCGPGVRLGVCATPSRVPSPELVS